MAWEPEKKEEKEPEESKDVAEEDQQPGPVDMKESEDVMDLGTTATATYPPAEDELYQAVTTLIARRIARQVKDDALPDMILDFVRSNLSQTAIKGDIEYSIIAKVTLDEAKLLREALV